MPECGNEIARWHPYYIKKCDNCEREGCWCLSVRTYVNLDNDWISFKKARQLAKRNKNIKLSNVDRKRLCIDCYNGWRKYGSLGAARAQVENRKGIRVWNLLFVSDDDDVRSRVAKKIARQFYYSEVDSSGIFAEAQNPLSKDTIEWADLIFAMEENHRRAILEIDARSDSKIIVLDIPNQFVEASPELENMLARKIEPYIENLIFDYDT